MQDPSTLSSDLGPDPCKEWTPTRFCPRESWSTSFCCRPFHVPSISLLSRVIVFLLSCTFDPSFEGLFCLCLPSTTAFLALPPFPISEARSNWLQPCHWFPIPMGGKGLSLGGFFLIQLNGASLVFPSRPFVISSFFSVFRLPLSPQHGAMTLLIDLAFPTRDF